MSASNNILEVVVLTDKLPRTLTMIVKVPGEPPRMVTSYWDTATSQFTPAVTQGLEKLINGIITRSGLRKTRS